MSSHFYDLIRYSNTSPEIVQTFANILIYHSFSNYVFWKHIDTMKYVDGKYHSVYDYIQYIFNKDLWPLLLTWINFNPGMDK